MKTTMNFMQLKGRLVSDPEVKTTPTGKKVMVFSLIYMTSQKTDSEGSHSNFITVEVWEKMAEVYGPLLNKGLQVIIAGTLLHQRWKATDGKQNSRYKLVADSIAITDLKYRPVETPGAA